MVKQEDINKYAYIRSKIKYFVFVCLYFFLYPICHILYGKKNNWLICERGDDAQDNGFVFFKYLVEHKKNIDPVYLIHKNSPDFCKVSTIGKVVEFGSFKHFLMMIGYPTKISSHLFGYSPWINSTLYYRRHKTRHKHVFLQHGIIKNLHEGLFGEVCKSLDLFVCGAEPEFKYVKDTFGYHNDVPKYTGLPRFDLLDDYECKNQILYMPTWRKKLTGLSQSEFLCSDFYLNWTNLINDKRINAICKNKNIKVKFYLHYALKDYAYLFEGNDVVEIVNFGKESVQDLLKESLLLITDFSSVYFDFAYMGKPVIYYQFDEDTFFTGHYRQGYFDYRRDGFGDVVNTCSSAFKSFNTIVSNCFKMQSFYKLRADTFFTLERKHNCERVFQNIVHIDK